MKRGLIVLIIFVFVFNLFQFTSSESNPPSSWMPSNFSILGCKMNNELLLYESCSRYGLFWCDSNGKLQDVFRVINSCRGKNKQDKFKEDDCCPANYYCNYETNLCALREYECSKFKQKDPCELNGCIWFEKSLNNYECLDRRQLISCSDYIRNSSCSRDLYRLGKTFGLGTDICKGAYVGTKLVISDSCKCSWEGINETSGICNLNYRIINEFDIQKDLLCKKQFKIGDCIEGKQNISWTINTIINNLELSNEELARFNCQNGSHIISCGYSVTKLSFFNFSNFIITLICITLIYILYKKNEK